MFDRHLVAIYLMIFTLIWPMISIGQTVEISAKENCAVKHESASMHWVSLALDPGVYDVTPVSTDTVADWYPWGDEEVGCMDDAGCTTGYGWVHRHFIQIDGLIIEQWDDKRYPAEGDALAAAAATKPSRLILLESSEVSFYVLDRKCNDNKGGVALVITRLHLTKVDFYGWELD